MTQCCDIWNVFEEKKYLLKEYKYWKLSLSPKAITLGNCVAITKRHIENFSDITAEEMQEFSILVKDAEKHLKAVFSYDKINYLMLMMVDKHVHFHILPRYSTNKTYAGLDWLDSGWPKEPVMKSNKINKEVLLKIKWDIQKSLLH